MASSVRSSKNSVYAIERLPSVRSIQNGLLRIRFAFGLDAVYSVALLSVIGRVCRLNPPRMPPMDSPTATSSAGRWISA